MANLNLKVDVGYVQLVRVEKIWAFYLTLPVCGERGFDHSWVQSRSDTCFVCVRVCVDLEQTGQQRGVVACPPCGQLNRKTSFPSYPLARDILVSRVWRVFHVSRFHTQKLGASRA